MNSKSVRTEIDPRMCEQIADVMARPYRKLITGSSEDGYLVEVPDLPGCMTAGETVEEALANLPEAMEAWIATALDLGRAIPQPTASEPGQGYNGRVLVRMPKTLHRKLVQQAEAEGVSLNQLAVALLARGLD